MSNSSTCQELDCWDPLSLPSEPPDIRNWFSSYAYESPELNTYEDCTALRVSDFVQERVRDGEMCKEGENLEGFVTTRNKDKSAIDEVNLNRSPDYTNTAQDRSHTTASQDLDSSNCNSQYSEPQPIERWFSSYVYESPILDTNIDLSSLESQYCGFDGAKCNAEEHCKAKEGNLRDIRSITERNTSSISEKRYQNGLAQCNNSIGNANFDLQCTNKVIKTVAVSSDPTDLPNEKNPKQKLKISPTQDHSGASAQSVRKTDADNEDFTRKEPLDDNTSFRKSENTQNKSKERSDMIQRPADTEKPEDLTSGSTDNENKENNFSDNGFISTRNKRSGISDASSLISTKVPLFVNTEDTRKRKPFSDRSNLHHSDALEIKGKWKCPQKRKPNLGPPLKQLRLEQWMNKI